MDIAFFTLYLENLIEPAKQKKNPCLHPEQIRHEYRQCDRRQRRFIQFRPDQSETIAAFAQAEGTLHFDPVGIVPVFCLLICFRIIVWPSEFRARQPDVSFPAILPVSTRPVDLVCKDPLWIMARPFPEALRCSLEALAFVIGLVIDPLDPSVSFGIKAEVELRAELDRCLHLPPDDGTDVGLADAHDAVPDGVVPVPVHGHLLFIHT